MYSHMHRSRRAILAIVELCVISAGVRRSWSSCCTTAPIPVNVALVDADDAAPIGTDGFFFVLYL